MKLITPMNEKPIVIISLSLILLTLTALAATTQISMTELDVYSHYFHSKTAFHNYGLFFDRWVRPLFLLVTYPFSSTLGMFGIKFVNIIASMFAAYITFLTAKHMKLKNAWLAGVLVGISPLLLLGSLSAITEVMFMLIIISVYYLYKVKKHNLAAIVSSIAFLSRDEGIILMG